MSMKAKVMMVAAAALAVPACSTTYSRTNFCNAEPGQLFIGQKADAASGLAIRRATGADVVRWAPPRSAMTMDFLEGRVTVAYDDAMNVTAVTCG
jgi:hypothetical protein